MGGEIQREPGRRQVRIIETIPTVQLFLDSSEALSGGTLEAGSNYRTMLS